MKKKIIYLSFILVLVISLITLSSIYKSKDNKYKKEYNTISKGMAIMIKEKGATDYVQSNSKDIPKGNYILNEEKTHCENNGKVTNYDSTTGTVSLNFIGSDRCYLYFDYKKETIKLGSTELVVNSETPDFNQIATTNEGLFKAQDDLGTSYYFRGAVDNNWVKFGKDSSGKDIYWRIIRINGDGSIRMIYTGTTAPTESTKVVMTGTGTQIGTSAFNSSTDKAEYVGYMYQLGQQHGNKNSTSSAIKTTIDNWYKTTTLETDLKTKSLVVDQIFCNDRTASTSNVTYSTTNYTTLTSWNSTETDYKYGAYGRLDDFNSNRTPILICPTASDKFTVNTSNGNGALTYPVGLITADEIAMAGGVKESANSSYYLYTNQHYWSGTPESFYSGGDAFEYSVYPSGANNGYTVYYIRYGARPVISLSSKAKLTGDGTWNNVFEVEKKGYETILANNTVNETTPDFSKVTTASEKGLYAADDDYTATTGMKSYYFRGAVDNNWVKFGKDSSNKDIYWRIIRINGDGSIRMIYTGTTDPSTDSSVTGSNGVYMTGTGTQITVDSTNTFDFNSSDNKAEHVGYQYIEGLQHGYGKCDGTNNASCTVNGNTVYNSTIKQAIDKWYAGTTLKDNDLIADQIFCNDRSASTSDVTYSNTNYTTLTSWNSTGTQYYYGARGRLDKSKSPVLTCPTASDKFTVGTSNGNGALTYPVGLITADEVAMAGGVYNTTNSSYYLYTKQYYWLGSPNYFDSRGYVCEFDVDSAGVLDYNHVGNGFGARPVVSLSSKAKLSGNGTYSKPYTVS